MTKMPAYYSTKTLLGGEPDRNRRQIYRSSDDRVVCVFNQAMREWTKQDEDELKACLAALLNLAPQ